MLRRSLVGLWVLLLLAGCAGRPSPVAAPGQGPGQGPGPGPAAPPAVGKLPRLLSAELRLTEQLPQGGQMLGQRPLQPGESIIAADGGVVSITLGGSPDRDWFRAVRLDGAVPPFREDLTFGGVLEIVVPPGAPGSVVTLTLPPVEGVEQTTYKLRRVAAPTVRVEVLSGGAWQAADPFAVYPAGNFQLRYRFTAPMVRATVEAALRRELVNFRRVDMLSGASLTWADDQTLEIRWPKAPPTVVRSLAGSQGQNGLYLVGPVTGVHTGAVPYLAALDPVTGAERRVRELVPEAFYAATARGGQVLLLHGFAVRGNWDPVALSWLYDLSSGGYADLAYDWNAHLVEGTGRLSVTGFASERHPGLLAGALSPDGTQRIFVTYPTDWTSGAVLDARLEVGRPDGEGRKLVYAGARVVHTRYEHGPDAAWSPDGRQIIFTSAVDKASVDLVVVDLASGGTRKVATVPRYSFWATPGPTLQWQGRRALVGESVVDLDSGRLLRTSFSGEWATRWLSPDGRFVLFGTFDEEGGDRRSWGPVAVGSVESGALLPVGEGLPAGWDAATGEALVVRWEGWRGRFAPPGL